MLVYDSQVTRGLVLHAPKMLQQAHSLSFLILFLLYSCLSVSAINSNVYVQCSQLNFTSTLTPYESNVNSLFSSLVDSAAAYNFNEFEISPQGNSVFGLFQCRGDLNSPSCKDCVASSISQLKTACPMSIGGEIQLEGCFVKYENTSFFGAQDKREVYKICGPSIGYNSDVLNRIDGAMAYLVGGNGQYFREGDFGSIQGVAQCVQDLSLSDCQDCLSEASGRLRLECVTSIWGDMYLGKCYVRYVEQQSKPTPNGGGSNNDIAKWIGYILAAALGAGGLSLAAKNFCNVNVQQRNNYIAEIAKSAKAAESAKEAAEDASKTAKKAAADVSKSADELRKKEEKRKKKEEKKRCEPFMPYYPNEPPMPPPYAYYPYPCPNHIPNPSCNCM